MFLPPRFKDCIALQSQGGAIRKILITTSDFTVQAIEEAGHTGTELINGIQLESLVRQYMPNFQE